MANDPIPGENFFDAPIRIKSFLPQYVFSHFPLGLLPQVVSAVGKEGFGACVTKSRLPITDLPHFPHRTSAVPIKPLFFVSIQTRVFMV
jgi:hypothetical protein